VILPGSKQTADDLLWMRRQDLDSKLIAHAAQGAEPFSILNGHQLDGCISPDTKVFGTYLHGIFDNDAFRHFFIASARSFHSLARAPQLENWKQKREDSFARLADTVRASLDLPRILDWAHPHVSTPGLH